MVFTIRHFVFAVCMMVAVNVDIAASFTEYDLFVLSSSSDYNTGVQLCKSHGMNILKIEDEYTNQLVFDYASQRNLGQYWIDGRRALDVKNWVYNDGSRMTYTKWYPGEPNNLGGENCIHGARYPNGLWNDINCNIKITVICYDEDETKAHIAYFTEKDLVVVSKSTDYKTAVSLCNAKGMHLVRIEDEYTNQMVYSYAMRKNLGQYWIDGNRGLGGKYWIYNDGSELSYSKWQPGEPNNLGGENCIHGAFYKNGFWNDISCNNKMTAMCYKRKSVCY